MSNIPQYKSQAPLQRKANQALTSEANLEAQKGQLISGTIGQAAQFMFESQMADEKIQKQTYLTEAALNLDAKMKNHQREITFKYAQNPDKAPDALNKAFESELQELSKGAPNPRAREEFLFSAENYGQAARNQILKWGDGQKIRNFKVSQDKLMDTQVVNTYRNPFDEEIYKQTQADASMIAGEFAATMDPQLVNEKGREYRQKVTLARFQGAFDIADKIFDAGPGPNETENDVIKKHNAVMNRISKMTDSKDFDYDLGEEGLATIRQKIQRRQLQRGRVQADYSYLKDANPWKFLEKMKIYVPPVDPKNLSESIESRVNTIKNLNSRFNMTAPVLSPADKNVFDRFMESASPEEQVQSFQALSQVEPNTRQLYVSEIAKQNMPIAFIMNGLASGELGEDKALEVLRGQSLLKKDKNTGMTGVVMPKSKDVQSYLDSSLGSRVASPEQKKAAGAIVYSALAARREGLGIDSSMMTEFTDEDQDAIDEAVKEYIGAPLEWNDSEIFSPPNTDAASAESVLDAMTDSKLQSFLGATPVNAQNRPVGIENNISGVILQPTDRRGVYLMQFNGQPLYYPRQQGQPLIPYEFNFNLYYQKESPEVKKPKAWYNRLLGR